MYPTYLIHFNKNHSSKNGQFTFGDGDGDGIRDDHAHDSKNNGRSTSTSSKNNSRSTSTSGNSSSSSRNHKTMLSGKSFVSDFDSSSINSNSTSENIQSFGWRGGTADPETEEEKKKRKSLRQRSLEIGVLEDRADVEGWIDDRVDASYKMWDLAYDRTDVIGTYMGEDGYRHTKTRRHRNAALDENKPNHSKTSGGKHLNSNH